MTDRFTTADGFTDGHLSDDALADIADARSSAAEPQQSAPVPAQHAFHLAECAACQAAVAATERVIAALHSPVAVEEPPPGLWDRIAADLDTETGSDAHDDADKTVHAQFLTAGTSTNNVADADRDSASDSTGGSDDSTTAQVHQLRPRSEARRAPWWGVFAAAAAGLLVGGAVIAGILNQDTAEEDTPVAGSSVGGATLEPVEADDFSGQAEMVEMEDGSMELTVEISSAPDPAEGYFEVWLRDDEASQLISLGAVTADSTTLQVPAGIDLAEYPVVDVSHEHFDGDPGHSGITLAAGPMEDEDS